MSLRLLCGCECIVCPQESAGRPDICPLAWHSWVYVKEHKLQDPADGRVIRPNQEMKDVFKVDSDIQFTQVMGLISKHLEKPTTST